MNKVNTNYLTLIDWFCEVTEIWTNWNWLLIETRMKWCSYMSTKLRFDSGWMITCHWLIMRLTRCQQWLDEWNDIKMHNGCYCMCGSGVGIKALSSKSFC